MSIMLSVAKGLNILSMFLCITLLASPILIYIYLSLVESIASLRHIGVQRKTDLVMCYTFSTVVVISELILLDVSANLLWVILITFLVSAISVCSTLNAIRRTQTNK